MDLSTRYKIAVTATATKAFDLDTLATADVSISFDGTMADGTAANQANVVYGDEGTLAGAADIDIDLAGALSDLFGDTITSTKVKALIVKNTSNLQTVPTDAEIQVGGGDTGDGTNAWDTWVTSTAADGSEAVKIPAGGAMALFAPGDGYAVTAGTGDILRIKNNDATDQAAYKIHLVCVTS